MLGSKLAILLLLCFVTCFSISPSTQQSNSNIDTIIQNNKDKIFPITSRAHFQQLSSINNNHHVLVLASAGEEMKAQCPYCGVLNALVAATAKLYQKKENKSKTKIYFAVYEYSNTNRDVAMDLQLAHIPAVFLYKKGSGGRDPIGMDIQQYQNIAKFLNEQINAKMNEEEYEQAFRNEVSTMEGMDGAQDTSSSTPPQPKNRTLTEIVTDFGPIVGLVLLLIVSVYSLIVSLPTPGSKRFAMTMFSLLLYIVCMGGTVYNQINNPPPFYYNAQQKSYTLFLSNQHNRQLGLEGYIGVSVMVICGLSILGTSELMKTIESPSIRRVLGYTSMWVFGIALATLVTINQIKMPSMYAGSPLYKFVIPLYVIFGNR